MSEIEVFRSVNFDWAMRLSEVWNDSVWDIGEIHANLRAEFARKVEGMRRNVKGESPLGWVVVGGGGTGKTHLLGTFRREAARRRCAFVLVDMTDIRSFWETVLQGYIDSLQQPIEDGVFQYEWVLRNIIERLGPNKPVAQILTILAERKSRDLQGDIGKVLAALQKVNPRETLKYQDVVRALICLNSEDFSISSLGMTWLQGQSLEDAEKIAERYRKKELSALDLIRQYGVIVDWGSGKLLEKTTHQFRDMLKRRTVPYWSFRKQSAQGKPTLKVA